MDVGVVLELSAPGMQDTSKTREIGPDEPFVFGEPFERLRRGFEHGVVREALMGADEGAQGLRDGEGEEEVRPRELFFQVVVEPLLSFMLLALGTVAVATGMMDAVLFPTAWALIQAVAVMSALAMLDGADGLSMRGRQMGRVLKVFWGEGSEDITESGHGRSPCMSELMRA